MVCLIVKQLYCGLGLHENCDLKRFDSKITPNKAKTSQEWVKIILETGEHFLFIESKKGHFNILCAAVVIVQWSFRS